MAYQGDRTIRSYPSDAVTIRGGDWPAPWVDALRSIDAENTRVPEEQAINRSNDKEEKPSLEPDIPPSLQRTHSSKED